MATTTCDSGVNYVPPAPLSAASFPVRLYAKVAVTDAEGRVLVLRRSNAHRSKAGKWDLPGGLVEVAKGERAPHAARRECREETKLELGPVTAVGMFCDTQTGKDNGKPAYCVGVLCTAPLKSGSVRLSWEHDAWHWAEPGCALVATMPAKYQNLIRLAQAGSIVAPETSGCRG
jgi:8-oxo-dGTP pyrophosphatase MutT (NUDIX family)